jgi:hypothetical protein
MALEAHLFVRSVFEISGLPVSRMGPDPAAAVALDANITLGMAGLTGLQVPASFKGMLAVPNPELRIAASHVRLDGHRSFWEPAVAGIAEGGLVVAANALLRIVQSLYRMDHDKVAAMAFRLIVAPEVLSGKVRSVAAAFVAIKTPGLLVTLAAVISRPAGQNTMSPHKVRIMVGRNTFALVA